MLSVQCGGIKYTHVLYGHYHHPSPEHLSSCRTEKPYPLNTSSLFPLPSPWPSPSYFLSLWIWLFQSPPVNGLKQSVSHCDWLISFKHNVFWVHLCWTQHFIPDNAVLQWLFCFASGDKCSYINPALKNQKLILKGIPTCSFVVTLGLVCQWGPAPPLGSGDGEAWASWPDPQAVRKPSHMWHPSGNAFWDLLLVGGCCRLRERLEAW